ncbi:hypothetical protein Caci_6936 [Catenulispora acidiphila DSM 44928]|uniref:BP74 N-terminal domain-containing protein n=1 Tax=Catenulispora acidiphila (strain DSM 44928 / JCM 14897 / NBRC 102108 / NRRL B-24433 / ID139908) TaxID=479433 RepID=C7Q3K4_CATAD|nr:hypothetical protein [Catenulispora acidiphila]ACU75769.1 hypothetical protein Caci_6936 [Catenulispora acidiphila DSM 44928]
MQRTLKAAIGALAAVAMIALTAVPASAASASRAKDSDAAYFVMTDVTHEQFVVRLDDPTEIEHARDLLSGRTTDRPHVIGRITSRTAPYNPRWSYHLTPSTVHFFDFAIEVCDATIPYVEEHLDEAGGAFLPGYVWCDWSSRLVKEISAVQP